MKMDYSSKAVPILQCSYSVSNLELRTTPPGYIHSQVRKNLVDQMADHIARECFRETVGDFSTEFRLRVYVLSDDQLARLIERRADAINRGEPANVSLLF